MDLDAGMDLLQGVQEADAPSGVLPEAGDFQMPSLEKMMEMLEHLDMSDEDKIELKKSLLQRGDILGKFAGLGQEAAAATPGGSFDPSTQFLVFFVAVALIAFVFVFFGYKLYKSLVEKEKKREDKKKQKMQKKKK